MSATASCLERWRVDAAFEEPWLVPMAEASGHESSIAFRHQNFLRVLCDMAVTQKERHVDHAAKVTAFVDHRINAGKKGRRRIKKDSEADRSDRCGLFL